MIIEDEGTHLIKVVQLESRKRLFSVGDIHGCYTKLIKKLNEIEFNFENDLLICVGDLCDRGEENLETISLPKEPWFLSVRGNHEQFCIGGLDGYITSFYHRIPQNGGAWFYKLPRESQEDLVKTFQELPVIIEVHHRGKKFGFVHADVPIEDWEHLKEAIRNCDIKDGRTIFDHCILARNVVNMDTVHIAQVDRVYLGHTVLKEPKVVGNCNFIDTGAVFGGDLTLVEVT